MLFRYTPKHNGSVRVDLLGAFKGHVIADASRLYHELYRTEPGITEVEGWAHSKRRWFDALAVDRDRAMIGIGFIGLLYDARKAATNPASGRTDTGKRRAAAGAGKALPRIELERANVVDESPIAKAMNDLLNQRISLYNNCS